MESIKNIFKRKEKTSYIIQVPRKGGSVVIGRIKSDIEHVNEDVVELIEKHKLYENPIVKQAKYIHLIDTKTGEKIKFENPFYTGEPEPETPKKQEKQENPMKAIQTAIQLDIVNAVMNSLKMTIPQVMTNTMKMIMDMQTEILKQSLGQGKEQQTSLRDLIDIGKMIIEFAKHRKEIEDLIKSDNFRKIIEKQLGENRNV